MIFSSLFIMIPFFTSLDSTLFGEYKLQPQLSTRKESSWRPANCRITRIGQSSRTAVESPYRYCASGSLAKGNDAATATGY